MRSAGAVAACALLRAVAMCAVATCVSCLRARFSKISASIGMSKSTDDSPGAGIGSETERGGVKFGGGVKFEGSPPGAEYA